MKGGESSSLLHTRFPVVHSGRESPRSERTCREGLSTETEQEEELSLSFREADRHWGLQGPEEPTRWLGLKDFCA